MGEKNLAIRFHSNKSQKKKPKNKKQNTGGCWKTQQNAKNPELIGKLFKTHMDYSEEGSHSNTPREWCSK